VDDIIVDPILQLPRRSGRRDERFCLEKCGNPPEPWLDAGGTWLAQSDARAFFRVETSATS